MSTETALRTLVISAEKRDAAGLSPGKKDSVKKKKKKKHVSGVSEKLRGISPTFLFISNWAIH